MGSSRQNGYFQALKEHLGGRNVPAWLSLDVDNMAGRVLHVPSREDVDVQLEEQLIVEFYSR